jgi:hypothetical protein
VLQDASCLPGSQRLSIDVYTRITCDDVVGIISYEGKGGQQQASDDEDVDDDDDENDDDDKGEGLQEELWYMLTKFPR